MKTKSNASSTLLTNYLFPTISESAAMPPKLHSRDVWNADNADNTEPVMNSRLIELADQITEWYKDLEPEQRELVTKSQLHGMLYKKLGKLVGISIEESSKLFKELLQKYYTVDYKKFNQLRMNPIDFGNIVNDYRLDMNNRYHNSLLSEEELHPNDVWNKVAPSKSSEPEESKEDHEKFHDALEQLSLDYKDLDDQDWKRVSLSSIQTQLGNLAKKYFRHKVDPKSLKNAFDSALSHAMHFDLHIPFQYRNIMFNTEKMESNGSTKNPAIINAPSPWSILGAIINRYESALDQEFRRARTRAVIDDTSNVLTLMSDQQLKEKLDEYLPQITRWFTKFYPEYLKDPNGPKSPFLSLIRALTMSIHHFFVEDEETYNAAKTKLAQLVDQAGKQKLSTQDVIKKAMDALFQILVDARKKEAEDMKSVQQGLDDGTLEESVSITSLIFSKE